MIDLKELTIKKAHDHLVSGDFSVQELTEAYLHEIEIKNKNLNAYLEIFEDAEEQARTADKVVQEQKDGAHLLTGIPIAVKDNILIKGRHASCGSKILETHLAAYDATVISKLKERHVVFLGRTNMDEFAMGSSTDYSAFGPTRNPHDESCSPGGSSGGSAAAVSGGLALAALGSDTGGSIRQPAGLNGIVGLKTTYGATSRHGLVALASSFDQIGPLTKTVEDARILFHTISGYDPMDSTSLPESHGRERMKQKTAKIIGVPYHFLAGGGIDHDVLLNFNASIELLEKNGYEAR